MLIVITSERPSPRERSGYNRLLALGLGALHLRMPGASREEYEEVICSIAPEYRSRLVICDHFDLVRSAGLGGIHLSGRYREKWEELAHEYHALGRISVAVHSVQELRSLPFAPTYALLSPVYDSLSKAGYRSAIDLDECSRELPRLRFPVLGLGGITPHRAIELRQYGFAGAATLGYLSAGGDDMVERWLEFDRPRVLSIGGHDPSSGAGILADARVIEEGGGYPLTICSCLTIQSERCFERIVSLADADIEGALSCILSAQRPMVAKVGMTPTLPLALQLIQRLRAQGVHHIIWDPIRSASASPEPLHGSASFALVEQFLQAASLITPNSLEAEWLLGETTPESISLMACKHQCAILIKGGHGAHPDLSIDSLYMPSGEIIQHATPRAGWDKHGTGCTLSATIALRLAQGYDLPTACRLGQLAVDALRRSSPTPLGHYRYEEVMIASKRRRLERWRLQWITDTQDEHSLLARAKAILEGGVGWIQLRMKRATSAERLRCALGLKALMRNFPGSVLIIDDDVEVALLSDADGVHLGLSDMPIAEARRLLGAHKIIGGTCNRPEDLLRRALEGADYVGIGPWRMTTTKERLSPLLGAEGIARLAKANTLLPHPLPMYAIGGITLDDLPTLSSLGVHGVALSGVLSRSSEPMLEAQGLVEAMRHLRFSDYHHPLTTSLL